MPGYTYYLDSAVPVNVLRELHVLQEIRVVFSSQAITGKSAWAGRPRDNGQCSSRPRRDGVPSAHRREHTKDKIPTMRTGLGRLLLFVIAGVLGACGGNGYDVPANQAGMPPPASGPGPISGLDFPGSAAVSTTMRFRFLNPLAIYPATYIWRAYPRQQPGFYTAFFWGNDDGQGVLNTFLWKGGVADTYYGAHPYPRGGLGTGTVHDWEIAIEQIDPVNGLVVKDQWYTQVFVAYGDGTGKHHTFYWNWPNTDASSIVTYTAPTSYGNVNPPVPALTWGDAPWQPGEEVWNGVLRGFQFYDVVLSPAEIAAEIANPGSVRTPWYLNLDPTPADITDKSKSGNGHHPEWVGTERPSLWTE